MKKLLIFLLLAIMCFAVSCDNTTDPTPDNTNTITPITPDDQKEKAYLSNGVEYVIDSDISCHITGIGRFEGEELVIPRDDGNGRIVNYIADYAFMNCTTVKKVTLPDSVKEINGGAFQNCTALVEINFSEGLNKIAVWAFYGCTSLTSVNFPESVDVIGQGSFSGCSSITSFNVAEGNEKYLSRDGVVYTKDMTTLVMYPIGNTQKSFTVPEGVKTINNASFSDCKYIENVTMASTVENIADHSFRRCDALATVTLSKSLTRIGVGAFYECTSLKTVNYPDTKEKWEDDEQMNLANTWDRGAGKYTVNYEYEL